MILGPDGHRLHPGTGRFRVPNGSSLLWRPGMPKPRVVPTEMALYFMPPEMLEALGYDVPTSRRRIAAMARTLYDFTAEGSVASAAAGTAKTILGVKGHANFGVDLLDFIVSMDGVAAGDKPTFVELGYLTWATNSPGTNSTSVTVNQYMGRAITAGFTAAKNWTAEPTAYTIRVPSVDYDPNKGVYYPAPWPLGETPDAAVSEGFGIRTTVGTAAGAVNYRAGMRVARA